MDRAKKNFLIDSMLFVLFVLLTGSGFLLEYLLPSGSGGQGNKPGVTVWGMTRHEWGSVHYWIALVMLGLMAVHLVLHWRWIVAMVRGKKREAAGVRALVGVFGLAGLMLFAAAPFISPKGLQEVEPGALEPEISGSMTLADVQAETGVPVSYLIEQLELPESTDRHGRLGQLRRRHGFELESLREIVAEYKESHTAP